MGKKGNSYYAVAKGRKPGIYNSWDDASVQVNGVANCYKGFKTLAEAQQFMVANGAGGVAASPVAVLVNPAWF